MFGLDVKSVAVGVLIGWFVVPMVMGVLSRGKTGE